MYCTWGYPCCGSLNHFINLILHFLVNGSQFLQNLNEILLRKIKTYMRYMRDQIYGLYLVSFKMNDLWIMREVIHHQWTTSWCHRHGFVWIHTIMFLLNLRECIRVSIVHFVLRSTICSFLSQFYDLTGQIVIFSKCSTC